MDAPIIRLVHAFGLSAPSVLVQGYIMAASAGAASSSVASEANDPSTLQSSSSHKIHVISSALSLFNICWGELLLTA